MQEYIVDIRKKIGNAPLLIPTVTVVVIRNNAILLQKRTDCNSWGLHGGALDIAETPLNAAERELFEEVGIKPIEMMLWKVYGGPEHHYIYPNNDEVYVVDIVYLCTDFQGELTPQACEVNELRWFSLKQIPEDIFPLDWPIIRDVVNEYSEIKKRISIKRDY